MATNFPSSLDSYTTKTDNVDTVMAAHINDVQDAIEALETKIGIDGSTDTSSIDYKVNNFFSTGRALWLYEDSAPTGWTIVSVTDAVLAVKGGTAAYNIAGGGTGGSWTVSGLSAGSHSHSLPAHNHQWYTVKANGVSDSSFASDGTSATIYGGTSKLSDSDLVVAALGGSTNTPLGVDYYTSSWSGTSGSASGSISSDGTWRPYGAVGIIVQKS